MPTFLQERVPLLSFSGPFWNQIQVGGLSSFLLALAEGTWDLVVLTDKLTNLLQLNGASPSVFCSETTSLPVKDKIFYEYIC